jgi:hypothetical protein
MHARQRSRNKEATLAGGFFVFVASPRRAEQIPACQNLAIRVIQSLKLAA